MDPQQVRTPRARRWWWLAVPVAVAAFALAYGITTLTGGGDSGKTQTVAPAGISFEQAHAVPLHISESRFARRVTVPPLQVKRRRTNPPQTCRYYRLTDQPGRYVFCFAKGELVLAYGGPTV